MNVEIDRSSFVRDPSYPAPLGLEHISIFTGKNHDAMVDFYMKVLNMRLVYEIRNRIHFTALSHDQQNHRIGLLEVPVEDRPKNSARIEHTSWLYRGLPDVIATVKRIEKDLGIWPAAVHQGTIMAFSYHDPDGNRVEFVIECMETQAEIIEFYETMLPANPDFNTLLPYDLRKLIALYDAGTPVDTLMDYNWILEMKGQGKL